MVQETARRAQEGEKEDPPNVKTAVLGSKILSEIHQDIARITLPSWIGRVPSDLGNKSHGTLSQDALRTTTTVILVSALPRIWGTCPDDSRERQILENFLDFSIAADVALMRSTSIGAADYAYDLLLKYLRGLRRLYPHMGLIPNQHISLHLRETLKRFGPAPGQRSNFLERINFLLQKVPTNSKPGKCHLFPFSLSLSASHLEGFDRGDGINDDEASLHVPGHPYIYDQPSTKPGRFESCIHERL